MAAGSATGASACDCGLTEMPAAARSLSLMPGEDRVDFTGAGPTTQCRVEGVVVEASGRSVEPSSAVRLTLPVVISLSVETGVLAI